MITEQIDNILKKLKPNKEDFKSFHLETTRANIWIEVNHIFFTTTNTFDLIIDYYDSKKQRKLFRNIKRSDIVKHLRNFKLLNVEQ